MSDQIETAVETVAEPVTEVIPDPTPEPEPDHKVTDDAPEFVGEILSRLDSLQETLAAVIANPADTGDGTPAVMPDDSSPARKPWTHRKLFGN